MEILMKALNGISLREVLKWADVNSPQKNRIVIELPTTWRDTIFLYNEEPEMEDFILSFPAWEDTLPVLVDVVSEELQPFYVGTTRII